MAFRFVVCPIFGSTPIGELELSDVAFNDPVYGAGASFEGYAEITDTQTRDRLWDLTVPDSVALYVLDDETDQYLFGGPVFDRPWLRANRRLKVLAQSWKGWTYQKAYGMNRATNPVSDRTFSNTNTDQFSIARNFMTAVLTGESGVPAIAVGSETSGVFRQLNVQGSDLKMLGSVIDSMANRDNGFEWNIDIIPNAARNPSLRLGLYFPGRGSLNNQILLIHQEVDGGNILAMGDPQETAAERRSRMWTNGAGSPPGQPIAYDEDPALSTGFVLLREAVKNYSSVTQLATLADHARSERLYRNHTLQSVTIEVAVDDPDYRVYFSGDKVRLFIEDEWSKLDLNSVRIVDRVFKLNKSGSDPDPDSISLALDLNDTELPENEAVV